MSFFSGGTHCRLLADESPEPTVLSTPFEDWCEHRGLDPDADWSWALFERTLPITPPEAGDTRPSA